MLRGRMLILKDFEMRSFLAGVFLSFLKKYADGVWTTYLHESMR